MSEQLATIGELAAFLNTSERGAYRVAERLTRGRYRVGRLLRFDLAEVREALRVSSDGAETR